VGVVVVVVVVVVVGGGGVVDERGTKGKREKKRGRRRGRAKKRGAEGETGGGIEGLRETEKWKKRQRKASWARV
jgi:hypothetical protein